MVHSYNTVEHSVSTHWSAQTQHERTPMELLDHSAQVLGALATLYGFAGALAVLLQARQMRERGSSGDVSVRFLATYVGGYAIWLLYGISIGSVPIIVVDAAGLCCGVVTLVVALRLRRERPACLAPVPSSSR